MGTRFNFALSLLGLLALQGNQAYANDVPNRLRNQMVNEIQSCLDKELSFLFIQNAEKGLLTAKAHHPGVYHIELKNVNNFMTYFAQKPNRTTGYIATTDFIHTWDEIKLAAHNSPTNAMIETIQLGSKGTPLHHGYAVTVTDYQYDQLTNTLSYDVKFLGNHAPKENKLALGYTTIFIDGANISNVAPPRV